MNFTSLANPVIRILVFLGLPLFCILGLGWATTQIENVPDGVRLHDRERYEEILLEIDKSKMLKTSLGPGIPEVTVSETIHDFGFLLPGTVSATHDFVFSNAGDGEVLLEVGATSCKCTLSKIDKPILAPGESTSVKVIWNVGSDLNEDFEQTAYVNTTDPKLPQVELTVKGKVAARVAAEHDLNGWSDLSGKDITATTMIYSQVFDTLIPVETKASSGRVSVIADPVAFDSVLVDKGKSAIQVTATYHPHNLSLRKFSESVDVRVVDPDSGFEEWVTIPFTGGYKSPITFFHPEIWKRGGLDLGLIELGSNKTWAISVRVRSDESVDDFEVLNVEPDSLKATIKKMERLDNTFQVVIELAKDAKPERFLGQPQGFVEVGSKSIPELRDWLPLQGQIIAPVQ